MSTYTKTGQSKPFSTPRGETSEQEQLPAQLPFSNISTEVGDLPPVLNPKEARAFLRLGRTAFYQALNTKQIPCAVRIGHLWRIPRDSFLVWLVQSGGYAENGEKSGPTQGGLT